MDIFAPVTLVKSLLTFANSIISGWCTLRVTISAPLLPACPTSRIELEYLSAKDTTPVLVLAAFLVGAPDGLKCETSMPTPPLLLLI